MARAPVRRPRAIGRPERARMMAPAKQISAVIGRGFGVVSVALTGVTRTKLVLSAMALICCHLP